MLVPFWELVNHSEDANCESDVTTTGVQLEVIVPELRKGDELTWYYGYGSPASSDNPKCSSRQDWYRSMIIEPCSSCNTSPEQVVASLLTCR